MSKYLVSLGSFNWKSANKVLQKFKNSLNICFNRPILTKHNTNAFFCKFCTKKGGKLAEIRTEAEMDAIRTFLYDVGSNHDNYYWIGLTDEETEGTFVWTSTGKEPKYTYWNYGEPNVDEDENEEDCVHLETYWNDRTWNDQSCNALYIHALCQIGKLKRYIIKFF